MSDLSQEYFDDKDIAPYDEDLDDFAAQSQEEDDDCAREGSIETNRSNGDGKSVDSSSDAGGSDEVSSVTDLEPELQEIKGLPVETEFRSK